MQAHLFCFLFLQKLMICAISIWIVVSHFSNYSLSSRNTLSVKSNVWCPEKCTSLNRKYLKRIFIKLVKKVLSVPLIRSRFQSLPVSRIYNSRRGLASKFSSLPTSWCEISRLKANPPLAWLVCLRSDDRSPLPSTRTLSKTFTLFTNGRHNASY